MFFPLVEGFLLDTSFVLYKAKEEKGYGRRARGTVLHVGGR